MAYTKNKEIVSRIVHKHDIEANWENAKNFIPMKGEIVVYDIDNNYEYERFKIGDGVTTVINLPFQKTNINDLKAVSYNIAQELTDEQKAQARVNINAQEKLTGTSDQVVGFDENGNAIVQPVVGKNVEGNIGYVPADLTFTEGIEKTAEEGAEIFNCYKDDDDVYANIAVGKYSHAEGEGTIAIGNKSHAEGWGAITMGDYSHAEGTGAVAFGRNSHAEGERTIASGDNSHTEGFETSASLNCAHAEGCSTKAMGYCSHSEGQETIALGENSHAEGYGDLISINVSGDASSTVYTINEDHIYNSFRVGQIVFYNNIYATIIDYDLSVPSITLDTTLSTSALNSVNILIFQLVASGSYSHAEGHSTVASGNSSHAEGCNTIASGENQHVQGKYNISDATFAHIVGNGISSKHSNAHTLDWSGNAWFSGDVYVGSTSGINKDEGSKKLVTMEDVEAYIEETILGGAW